MASLVQVTPSPSKPLRQVHSKLPMVSVQLAWIWQSSFPNWHSLMSMLEKN